MKKAVEERAWGRGYPLPKPLPRCVLICMWPQWCRHTVSVTGSQQQNWHWVCWPHHGPERSPLPLQYLSQTVLVQYLTLSTSGSLYAVVNVRVYVTVLCRNLRLFWLHWCVQVLYRWTIAKSGAHISEVSDIEHMWVPLLIKVQRHPIRNTQWCNQNTQWKYLGFGHRTVTWTSIGYR